MSTESTHPLDPPYRRPTYHDGMLLEADDFLHEQEYHRKRLANALLRLHGAGTVAGLRVLWKKGSNEVAVAPGVAVDVRGRVLELEKELCLRVGPWLEFVMTGTAPAVLVGAGGRAVVADVYASFVAKEEGLRPAFPEAAADALDAVVPFRLVDAVKITMHAVPAPLDDAGPDFSAASAAPTRAQLVEAVLDSFSASPSAEAAARIGEGLDRGKLDDALFLSRVRIPVLADGKSLDPARDVTVNNDHRPLAPSAAFLFSRLTLNQLAP